MASWMENKWHKTIQNDKVAGCIMLCLKTKAYKHGISIIKTCLFQTCRFHGVSFTVLFIYLREREKKREITRFFVSNNRQGA